MVSAMTRTQAYTTDTCMAFLGVTDLPALLPPKEKVVAALTAFCADCCFPGLSRARNRAMNGFFIGFILLVVEIMYGLCYTIFEIFQHCGFCKQ